MRAITDKQRQQHAVFLKELRHTGNVAMAAEAAGCFPSTLHRRRKRFPDFATGWDAAMAFARARLARGAAVVPNGAPTGRGAGEITRGGEYAVRYRQNGVMQVRRACAGELSAIGERAFLAHLAATANISLSAEAVGCSVQAIYRRKKRSVDFARALDAALAEGFEAPELALLAHAIDSLSPDGERLEPDPAVAETMPPLWERMTADHALMLLQFHRSTVRLGAPRLAHNRRPVTVEETNKVLRRAIRAVEARRRRDG